MIENEVDETKIKDFSNSNGKDIAGISESQWQKLLGPVKGITIYNAISKVILLESLDKSNESIFHFSNLSNWSPESIFVTFIGIIIWCILVKIFQTS